jgi:hypothetical protein
MYMCSRSASEVRVSSAYSVGEQGIKSTGVTGITTGSIYTEKNSASFRAEIETLIQNSYSLRFFNSFELFV